MRASDPHQPRRSTTRRRFVALSAAAALAGCGGPAVLPPGWKVDHCRTTIPAPEGDPVLPVRWTSGADPGGAGVLDAWCAAVGPAVMDPLPMAQTAAPLDSLAVVSWNMHGGGGDLAALVADLRAGRWTGGAPVAHFAILAQEVHRAGRAVPRSAPPGTAPRRVAESPPSAPRLDVVELARALGLSLLYVPSMRNGEPGEGEVEEDRGNAVLSTLPLADPLAVELPFESQRRVAVAAVLGARSSAGGEWRIRLVSVHLDTRSVGGRLWASFGAGRLRQADALARALPRELPTVVAGDMNTWSAGFLEGALAVLRADFPDTPPAPPGPTLATRWGYRRRLDYMFFRLPEGWTARYRRLDRQYGSDHYPLLGWVRLHAEPRPPSGLIPPVLP